MGEISESEAPLPWWHDHKSSAEQAEIWAREKAEEAKSVEYEARLRAGQVDGYEPEAPREGRSQKRKQAWKQRAMQFSGTEPAKEDEVLPSWRAREINEERRQVQAELERTRAELARAQAWAQQQQRQAQPAQEPPAPDPMLDYNAYTKYVQDKMRAEFMQQRAVDMLNMDLRMAHMQHGDRFEKAYEALVVEKQRGNQALVNHLTSQANPGEAIVRWHTQNEVLREVGPDPSAYKQKTREQLLNDPEFRAQAEAHWREQAMGHTSGNSGQPSRPNTVVRMPPSLSKATGSSEIPQTSTDGSEAALFNYAMQPKRR